MLMVDVLEGIYKSKFYTGGLSYGENPSWVRFKSDLAYMISNDLHKSFDCELSDKGVLKTHNVVQSRLDSRSDDSSVTLRHLPFGIGVDFQFSPKVVECRKILDLVEHIREKETQYLYTSITMGAVKNDDTLNIFIQSAFKEIFALAVRLGIADSKDFEKSLQSEIFCTSDNANKTMFIECRERTPIILTAESRYFFDTELKQVLQEKLDTIDCTSGSYFENSFKHNVQYSYDITKDWYQSFLSVFYCSDTWKKVSESLRELSELLEYLKVTTEIPLQVMEKFAETIPNNVKFLLNTIIIYNSFEWYYKELQELQMGTSKYFENLGLEIKDYCSEIQEFVEKRS